MGASIPCFFSDPFCPELRDIAIDKIKKLKYSLHSEGTYICIEGVFTRAESRFFRDVMKADIIGMTHAQRLTLQEKPKSATYL